MLVVRLLRLRWRPPLLVLLPLMLCFSSVGKGMVLRSATMLSGGVVGGGLAGVARWCGVSLGIKGGGGADRRGVRRHLDG